MLRFIFLVILNLILEGDASNDSVFPPALGSGKC